MRRPQLIAIGLGTFASLGALAVLVALTLSGGGEQAAETPVAIAPAAVPTNFAQSSTPAFQVRSGPAQGDLRLPHLESVTPVATTADGLKALEPRAALVGAADQSRFNLTGASLTKGSNGEFLAEVRYASGAREQLSISSWTPTGTVDLVLPLSSPVSDIRQTTVGGATAVLVLNAAGVQGSSGHRAYLASGGVVYFIEAQGTSSNDDFVGLVARIVEGLSK